MKKYLIVFLIVFAFIVANAQNTVEFNATTTSGCGLVQTVFKDSSITTSPIKSYLWDLGGVLSDKASPGKVFDKPDKYKICLTITLLDGKVLTRCKENYIEVFEKPIANFSLDKNQGCSPVTVNFKDNSSSKNGKITQWIWDIGGSSNVLNVSALPPIISSTYTADGIYSLSLTIKDEKGCAASAIKKDILKIEKIQEPLLTKKYLQSCTLPWTVEIKNNNPQSAVTYNWAFGNGTTFTGQNPPIVTYDRLGNYDLTLIAKKGLCTDTTFIKDFISTNPVKAIVPDTNTICEGSTIRFKDASEVAADSIRWIFHNGMTSSEKTPTFLYPTEGCFNVKLLRYTASCKDSTTYNCIKVNRAVVPTMSIDNQFKCTVPVDISATSPSVGMKNWELTGGSINLTASGNTANFRINNFGSYKLKLNFIDSKGCAAELIKDVDIKKFDVNLPGQFVGGCAPYEVSLADSIFSENPITSYSWSIGPNGSIHKSNLAKPKFNLTNPGYYDVTLIARNSIGCIDTTTRLGYVQGGVPPTVDFSVSPPDTCVVVKRTFTAITSPNTTKWEWNLGDKTIEFSKDVEHIYSAPEKYDVTLTASDRGCATSVKKAQFVTVNLPLASFDVEHNCDTFQQIKLRRRDLGADSLYWIINYQNKIDTIRDTLLSQVNFPDRGLYFVSMYTKNVASGCEHIRTDSIFITEPLAKYTVDTLQGCAPMTIGFNNGSQDFVEYKFIRAPGDTLASSSIQFINAGTYQLPSLLVIDRHGCRDSIEYSDLVKVNRPFAKALYDNTICVPALLDLQSTSVDSFGSIVKTSWQVGTILSDSNMLSVMIDKPGLIDVKLSVIDSWGCTDSLVMKEAVEAVELIADFTVDSLGCTNQDLLFVPKGDGINTSEYIWSLGDGVIDSNQVVRHRFTNEGSYDVCLTLKDRRGCENTICKDSIIKVNNPRASFVGDKLSETCPPLLTNFTNNSTNAISYQWDFGDKSGLSSVDRPSHVYLEPDSFDVSLIAIRSETCRDTLTRREYITLLGPVATVDYKILSNCLPLDIAFQATSDKFYQYIWDFGNGIVDSSLTITDSELKKYTYSAAGSFDAKLLVTDGSGCQRTFSMPTIAANEIQLDFVAKDSVLCGTSTQLDLKNNSTASDQNVFYNWQIINNTDTLSYVSDSVTTSLDKYGYYDIVLTGEMVNCRDTLNKDKSIVLAALPVVNSSMDSLLCIGNFLNISDTSIPITGQIDSVIWLVDNKLLHGKSISVKLLTPGNYDVKQVVKTSEGCMNERLFPIDVKDNLLIELGKDTLLCQGELIKLSNKFDPLLMVNFFQDGRLKCANCSSYELFPVDTTSIFISYANLNGCISEDSIIINLVPEPSPVSDLGQDTTICINNEAIIKVLNYNPQFTYEWPQYNSNSCLPNCAGIKFIATQPLKVVNKVTNKYGCFTYDTLAVSIESGIPDILLSDRFICEGDEFLLSSPSSVTNIAWLLKTDTICRACDSIKLKPTRNETYTIIVKSENECLYRDTVNVQLIKPSSIDAGKDHELCIGEELTVIGKGVGEGIWYRDNDTISPSNELKFFPQSTATYILRYEKDQCTMRDTMDIVVLDKVNIQADGDTLCFGDAIYLKADGDAFTYEWFDAMGKLLSANKIDSLLGEKSIDVTLVGKRTTCLTDSIKVAFKVHPPIDYKVADEDIKVYYNTKHFVRSTYDPTRNYTYQWFPDYALSCNDCPEPIVANLVQTELFQVIVTDQESGCATEVFFNAELDKNCSEKAFIIPNVIKPGSANDVFELKHGFIDDFNSITVMDRWGNKVFTSNDLTFKWDGKHNGQVLNPGVYVYVISANCVQKNNEPYQFGGDVTILR